MGEKQAFNKNYLHISIDDIERVITFRTGGSLEDPREFMSDSGGTYQTGLYDDCTLSGEATVDFDLATFLLDVYKKQISGSIGTATYISQATNKFSDTGVTAIKRTFGTCVVKKCVKMTISELGQKPLLELSFGLNDENVDLAVVDNEI